MIKTVKFLVLSLGIFALLSTVSYFSLAYFMPAWLPSTFWLLPTYYGIASLLLSWFAAKASTDKRFLSLQVLIGARLIVVVLGLMFLFVGLFFDKEHAVSLTTLFVVFYVVFSILETKVMLELNKVK
jgi:hypothetical protein